ncbi:type ISP restriction/modification enzyme [Maricaulis sp.]|uniref:type ISP restriction/modification enzyme n=1 Tax=Maricaulis sp. TaxID=1486257 RepID=UPI003A926036
MSAIAQFFGRIKATYETGEAREHAYRPALQWLFEAVTEGVDVINEARKTEVGAPDFIFLRKSVPVGYCEAKDIDKGLATLAGYSVEQKKRYIKGFPNLLYTNGLEFEFWREGKLIREIRIGEILMGLQPIPEAFDELEHQLRDFFAQTPLTIHSSKVLAEKMAGKAILIKEVMGQALMQDLRDKVESELVVQYRAFGEHLIHDITAADFADIYAETIAYGLFAGRLHDPTPDDFSRAEALELLPKSNPFLRSLFSYIAGPDLDDRMAWIIDDLAKVFLACDLAAIMADFGKLTGQNDPFLHFYETFLAAYNPAKRKARGVWYTPEPVVNFIVRAVDDVLKTEFGLVDGLADTSKVKIELDTGQRAMTKKGTLRKSGETAKEIKEVHRVQILDPATGTGTFLAEVIKQIAPRIKGVAPGMWSQYIEQDLIPRLHGFELLMASYAMCHMKLDMILTELGYKPTGTPPRLSVYLTNSLEEGDAADQTLPFAQWLSKEAKGANTIKRDMPIMCVIGNPPYSGISQNNGDWITGLIEDYKYVDGVHFGERKHWLQDDYVKFIRLAESLIEKNGEGVLGFITNHGYLDNPTFRGMRWHLMQTFGKIYVLDLHGNANKKEKSPNGNVDQNVFDIRQGVAIVICVKKSQSKNCEVYHKDLFGSRKNKYEMLNLNANFKQDFERIGCLDPYFMFYPINVQVLRQYDDGFLINEFMPVNQKGVITARDHLSISFTQEELSNKLALFCNDDLSDSEVRSRFWPKKKAGKYEPGDTRGWKVPEARRALREHGFEQSYQAIQYRPFDTRMIAYTPTMVDWPRTKFMTNFLRGDNFGLMFNRGIEELRPFFDAFVFDGITQHHSLSLKEANNIAPLYLYPAEDELDQSRRINFDPKLFAKLKKCATDPKHGEPNEVQVFDYIYGVLHCPAYRETFAEFLRIDFPRIPWPKSPDVFWSISEKGTQLRRLHLMEEAMIGETPYPFDGEGDGIVEKPVFTATKDGLGDVWINKTQRFAGVPEISWNFYIGGYQPAQKWLKDRKGRTLSYDDIRHYQKIIKILAETDRIMQQIEMPIDLEDGAGN